MTYDAQTKYDANAEPIMTTLFSYTNTYYGIQKDVVFACAGWKDKDAMLKLAVTGGYIKLAFKGEIA